MNNNKVQTVVIGKRTVILDPTWGGYEKNNKRWGLKNGEVLSGDILNEFCIDAIWTALKRRYVFKPFITKKRMKRLMKPWDMERIIIMVDWVYTGKIFTEDELAAAVEDRKKEIADRIAQLKREWNQKTPEEIERLAESHGNEALGSVKKNG